MRASFPQIERGSLHEKLQAGPHRMQIDRTHRALSLASKRNLWWQLMLHLTPNRLFRLFVKTGPQYLYQTPLSLKQPIPSKISKAFSLPKRFSLVPLYQQNSKRPEIQRQTFICWENPAFISPNHQPKPVPLQETLRFSPIWSRSSPSQTLGSQSLEQQLQTFTSRSKPTHFSSILQ